MIAFFQSRKVCLKRTLRPVIWIPDEKHQPEAQARTSSRSANVQEHQAEAQASTRQQHLSLALRVGVKHPVDNWSAR